ncbi:hypothetical protein [Rhodococcus sp. NPDC058639]|uniref:hypothetical protein n=1 Tax=Rhodococcus sp. NPDC058639 TaxID=3346570 RepID=UPI0036586822
MSVIGDVGVAGEQWCRSGAVLTGGKSEVGAHDIRALEHHGIGHGGSFRIESRRHSIPFPPSHIWLLAG